MNTVLVAFVSGIAFGTGVLVTLIAYLMLRTKDTSSAEYNRRTVELLEERNKIDERIAVALERGAK